MREKSPCFRPDLAGPEHSVDCGPARGTGGL